VFCDHRQSVARQFRAAREFAVKAETRPSYLPFLAAVAACAVLCFAAPASAQQVAPPVAEGAAPPSANPNVATPPVPATPPDPATPAAPRNAPAPNAVPNAATLPVPQPPTSPPIQQQATSPPVLQISSTSFPDGGEIPEIHTCKGADASPPLAWTGAPAGTKSFALIVDDPDAPDPAAPQKTWVHWVLYDIEPQSTSLSQDYGRNEPGLPVRAGVNDWARTGYGGPCPPIGRHRYFFKLYALDTVLGDLGRPDKAALEQAMEGHVLAKAQLVGTFRK
jgi:Raf kinase inhibitor-like YbhB/YbcL family protein